jgi:hypothetical protein
MMQQMVLHTSSSGGAGRAAATETSLSTAATLVVRVFVSRKRR